MFFMSHCPKELRIQIRTLGILINIVLDNLTNEIFLSLPCLSILLIFIRIMIVESENFLRFTIAFQQILDFVIHCNLVRYISHFQLCRVTKMFQVEALVKTDIVCFLAMEKKHILVNQTCLF